MTTRYCNECIDVLDGRFNDWIGCVAGTIYGPCDHELCGGICESVGDCDCTCHSSDGPS